MAGLLSLRARHPGKAFSQTPHQRALKAERASAVRHTTRGTRGVPYSTHHYKSGSHVLCSPRPGGTATRARVMTQFGACHLVRAEPLHSISRQKPLESVVSNYPALDVAHVSGCSRLSSPPTPNASGVDSVQVGEPGLRRKPGPPSSSRQWMFRHRTIKWNDISREKRGVLVRQQ